MALQGRRSLPHDAGKSDRTSHSLFCMSPPPPSAPTVIGLLGGIAAGKSAVAGLFAEAGFRHVDADALARRVVEEPDVREAILARFGSGVFSADGLLDRAALARAIFADARARADLEGITHPAIRARILAALAAAREAGVDVVLDAPLLLEGGLIEHCQASVFIASGAGTREARARARGWEDGELARREAAQASLAEKRARARWVIDNDGPLDATRAQVQAIIAELRT